MGIVSTLMHVSASGSARPSDVVAPAQMDSSQGVPMLRPKSGSVGKGWFADNVRFLFINGCAYEEWESKLAAQKISSLFGEVVGKDVRVHYTYLPMTFGQVIKAIRYEKEPEGCDVLLESIRERLQELHARDQKKAIDTEAIQNGHSILNGGARLCLVTHSGGGVFAEIALRKLTEKERLKIDVFSFGSPCLFKKCDYHNAQNAIAFGDPFPFLGWLISGMRTSDHFVRAGSMLQMPVLSHKFLNKPYQVMLKKIVDMYAREVRKERPLPPLLLGPTPAPSEKEEDPQAVLQESTVGSSMSQLLEI